MTRKKNQKKEKALINLKKLNKIAQKSETENEKK